MGVATIGIGHKLRKGEGLKYGNGLKSGEEESIFRADISEKENLIRKNLDLPITQSQFDALLSLAFTNEAAVSRHSTLMKKLNAGDIVGAADEFTNWDRGHIHHTLVTVPGLTKRRAAEKTLFLTGNYDSKH